uniref:Uncharacterized protein n=1 Tax=Oryza nivara TaxID=4536 RepID=A0A0E0FHP9_ORYNI
MAERAGKQEEGRPTRGQEESGERASARGRSDEESSAAPPPKPRVNPSFFARGRSEEGRERFWGSSGDPIPRNSASCTRGCRRGCSGVHRSSQAEQ